MTMPQVRWSSVVRAAWPACLLTALCLLPYLNKGFTVDDPTFLAGAQQLLRHSLRPFHGYDAGGTLMAYLMVPVVLAGGKSGAAEWLAHSEQLLFSLGAVCVMVSLALRLGWSTVHATFAGLLLVATPPFLPMASTAMPDTLALLLGLLAVERLVAWKQNGRWPQAILASLALGLGPQVRPHLVLMFPLGAFLLLDRFSLRDAWEELRTAPRKWIPIGLGLLVFTAVNFATRDRGLAVNLPPQSLWTQNARSNLFAYFLYWSVPIPLALPWIACNWRKSPWILVVIPAAGAMFWSFLRREDTEELWALAAMAFGAAAIVHIFWEQWKRRDAVRLVLALWLLLPLAAVPYVHLPIKYHLAAVPAAILLLLDLADTVPARVALSVGTALVFVGAIYSVLILHADNRFTEQRRLATARLIVPHIASGEKVWYSGGWGFQWYAERAGALRASQDSPPPQPGDFLAVAVAEEGGLMAARLPNRTLVDSLAFECECGRTMTSGAGLYSNLWGNLLWVWSGGETGRYELWRMR